jgi:hypothetical protein
MIQPKAPQPSSEEDKENAGKHIISLLKGSKSKLYDITYIP